MAVRDAGLIGSTRDGAHGEPFARVARSRDSAGAPPAVAFPDTTAGRDTAADSNAPGHG